MPAHRGSEEDEGRDDDVERTGHEEGPPPRDEAGVVLQQAIVDLRHNELDGASACRQ